jgi:uncharacterized protein YjbI with pentapeptide repeats
VLTVIGRLGHDQRLDLRRTDLRGSYLPPEAPPWHVNLYEAHLEGALLWGADLGKAQFKGADLRKAQLEQAFFGEANLEGANLETSSGLTQA